MIQFQSLFSSEGYEASQLWAGESNEDGFRTMPYPVYKSEVDQFFALASQEQWCDYEYNPSLLAEKINSIGSVGSASIPEIKSMLTYCVRGERFSDGHLETMIKSGVIAKLLSLLWEHRNE